MAYAYNAYTGDNSTTDFAVSFEYLAKSNVKVYVDGVETSFTWNGDATVRISPAPSSGAYIKVVRETPLDDRQVNFQDGEGLDEATLDLDSNQLFFILQEATDKADDSLKRGTGDFFNAEGKEVKNAGEATSSSSLVTLSQLQDAELAAGNLPDVTTDDNGKVPVVVAGEWSLTLSGTSLGYDVGTEDDELPTYADVKDYVGEPTQIGMMIPSVNPEDILTTTTEYIDVVGVGPLYPSEVTTFEDEWHKHGWVVCDGRFIGNSDNADIEIADALPIPATGFPIDPDPSILKSPIYSILWDMAESKVYDWNGSAWVLGTKGAGALLDWNAGRAIKLPDTTSETLDGFSIAYMMKI